MDIVYRSTYSAGWLPAYRYGTLVGDHPCDLVEGNRYPIRYVNLKGTTIKTTGIYRIRVSQIKRGEFTLKT